MYVPILKNKKQEYIALKDMNQYFGKDIIPMIEIIKDKFIKRYKTNPENGEFIYTKEKGQKGRRRIPLDSEKEEDRITLDYLSEHMQNKRCFVDFFRTKITKKSGINTLQIALESYSEYSRRIFEIAQYENFIPVISIKDFPHDNITDLQKLLTGLKKIQNSIAVRIVVSQFDRYFPLLQQELRPEDFFIVDIEDSPVDSVMTPDLQLLVKTKISGHKIIVNSTRKTSYGTIMYEEDAFTIMIDCSLKMKYQKMGFSGFGDYCGVKNTLNTSGGGNCNNGYALALLYCSKENQYYSVRNKDNTGYKGYENVVKKILSKQQFFNPDNDCPVINRLIKDAEKQKYNRSWATWVGFTIKRTIHQHYKSFNL